MPLNGDLGVPTTLECTAGAKCMEGIVKKTEGHGRMPWIGHLGVPSSPQTAGKCQESTRHCPESKERGMADCRGMGTWACLPLRSTPLRLSAWKAPSQLQVHM